MNMEISEAQPESIVGGWRYGREGLLRTRERFIVQWANQEGEGLVVYVRHEWQEQSGEMGAAAKFGTVEHSQSRETALLDRIQTELSGLTR